MQREDLIALIREGFKPEFDRIHKDLIEIKAVLHMRPSEQQVVVEDLSKTIRHRDLPASMYKLSFGDPSASDEYPSTPEQLAFYKQIDQGETHPQTEGNEGMQTSGGSKKLLSDIDLKTEQRPK